MFVSFIFSPGSIVLEFYVKMHSPDYNSFDEMDVIFNDGYTKANESETNMDTSYTGRGNKELQPNILIA